MEVSKGDWYPVEVNIIHAGPSPTDIAVSKILSNRYGENSAVTNEFLGRIKGVSAAIGILSVAEIDVYKETIANEYLSQSKEDAKIVQISDYMDRQSRISSRDKKPKINKPRRNSQIYIRSIKPSR